MDTLGRNRTAIARSLARGVPVGTTVVNGETDPILRSYITAELNRRDATVRHVDPPEWATEFPGAEVVFGMNEVLNVVGEQPLPPTDIDQKLGAMLPQWRILEGGRLYDASDVNDVQSTEIIRQALIGNKKTVIEPVVNLRDDRRGRTASFRRYLDDLVTNGHAERVHALGNGREVFANTTDFPVRTWEEPTPEVVITDALAAGNPVLIMGNTVTEFMRELTEEIETRTVGREPAAISQQDRLVKGT